MGGEIFMEDLDPLHAACEAGDTKAVVELLESDLLLEQFGQKAPGVNSVARYGGTSKAGFTPIFYAALSGEPETCRVLVERGADPLALALGSPMPSHAPTRCSSVTFSLVDVWHPCLHPPGHHFLRLETRIMFEQRELHHLSTCSSRVGRGFVAGLVGIPERRAELTPPPQDTTA